MDREEGKGMGRREFIGAAAAALFAGVSITLVGCDESEPTKVADGDVAGTISGNHGHSVVLTKAKIDEGGAVTLSFSGGTHTHTVSLTAEDVAKVKSGVGVHNATTSVTNDHTHTVMFMKSA